MPVGGVNPGRGLPPYEITCQTRTPPPQEPMPQRGIPLALVTNGDASQRYKIARHDRARFFDAIVVEGEFGAGKPDEAVYRHALGALGMAPGEAMMVDHHLEWDVGRLSGSGSPALDGRRWARATARQRRPTAPDHPLARRADGVRELGRKLAAAVDDVAPAPVVV